ncbi:hypothetical protein [Microbulbifer hainanensis]|uniref:hypothetical protein n=1 Tax=Microbulbifer hainanensis TaxID=2735675 RepID=UPI001867B9CE|nr:hypothetical protein [Microbulbifer hainanensis]
MTKRIICFISATFLLVGCAVSTKRIASDYSRDYFLASDTRVWTDCEIWTDWYSLNFGGLENVNCLVSEHYNSPAVLSSEKLESDKKRMIVLNKGSLVRIKRIFTIVHTGVTNAELMITDSESGKTERVFATYWPNENPNLLEAK